MLAELFSEGPYRFQMRFARNSIADFYKLSGEAPAVLGERSKWLRETPELCCLTEPDSAPMLRETISLLGLPSEPAAGDASELCARIGRAVEPDILVLEQAENGPIVLRGGCVCFPSSWDLREKIGREIGFIHGVVPGLNAALGSQIDGFLRRIRPGTSWDRVNWGLSRSPELNHHPERHLPRLDSSVSTAEVFLRIEYQSLAALPESKGILFGIRVKVHPLAEVIAELAAARGLIQALGTMPEEMARYKGLAGSRERILTLLKDAVT